MKIIIDLQACQSDSRSRGIGRYSLSLAQNMVKQLTLRSHDVWIVLNDNFPDTIIPLSSIFQESIAADKIVILRLPSEVSGVLIENSWRNRAAELIREYFIAQFQPDYVHVTSLFDGWGDDAISSVCVGSDKFNTVVTLYDLIPYILDDIYLQDKQYKIFYLRKLAQLKKANLLFAISEHSRSEVIKLLKFNPEKVVNISSAIEPTFKPVIMTKEEVSGLLNRYGIEKSFLLYVPGGFDPRKNFDRLIQAFTKLPSAVRNSHQLVIASKLYQGHKEMLKSLAALYELPTEQMILTDYVVDKDLIALYSLCKLYVYPSIHEGFGLPALEAMACGAPVIGSNTTSIPEVIGYKRALFNPYSVEDISSKILYALTDQEFLDSLRTQAKLQSKKFSWEQSASRAVLAIESSCKKSGNKKKSDNVQVLKSYQIIQKIILDLQAESNITKPSVQDLSMIKNVVDYNLHMFNQRRAFVNNK